MVKVLAYNKKKVYASCHGNVSTVRKTADSKQQQQQEAADSKP
jgi:hypothetical protein